MTTITMPPLAVEVLPADRPDWAYEQMEQDFKDRRYVWREVDEAFYWQALEVLPPLYTHGGFLVGEPWSHTVNNEPICAAFTTIGHGPTARYFATMSTKRGFRARRAGLVAALGA